MKNAIKLFIVVIFILAVVGCNEDSVSSEDENNPIPVAKTGVFVDAFVSNIGYRTATQEGITNGSGEFLFFEGETVTFFIGALEFPVANAQTVVTPFTLAGANNIADQQVINISRLLQSLDDDGIPENGITIPVNAAAIAGAVNFNVDTSAFGNSQAVINLIANSGSVTTTLLPINQVVTHLNSNFNVVGTWLSDEESIGFILFDDGRFMFMENDEELPDGMESGTYVYDPNLGTLTFNITFDNNSDGGIAPELNGVAIPASVNNGQLTAVITDSDGTTRLVFSKQTGTETSIAGTWLNEPSSQEPFSALVLTTDNRFFYGEGAGELPNGMELGTYIYETNTNTISFTTSFDGNSDGGIAPDFNGLSISAALTGNILTLDGTFILNRQ